MVVVSTVSSPQGTSTGRGVTSQLIKSPRPASAASCLAACPLSPTVMNLHHCLQFDTRPEPSKSRSVTTVTHACVRSSTIVMGSKRIAARVLRRNISYRTTVRYEMSAKYQLLTTLDRRKIFVYRWLIAFKQYIGISWITDNNSRNYERSRCVRLQLSK